MTQAIAMQTQTPGEPLVAATVELAAPPPGWVRVDVVASGVCFADVKTARAEGARAPVTPGHEIAGVIADAGAQTEGWRVGERVAVGWFGGSCGQCAFCRNGDPVHCPDRMIPGHHYPGGWAESITVPAGALARIPDGLDFFDAAPMGCGHVTGSAADTEKAMQFALLNNVRPMIERMSLTDVNEAIGKLGAGEARFRIVLDATRRQPLRSKRG